MALCPPNEQMLQLTFPPLFLDERGILKTLAYSQQHLLPTVKFKDTFFSILLWFLILKIIAHLCCIIQG